MKLALVASFVVGLVGASAACSEAASPESDAPTSSSGGVGSSGGSSTSSGGAPTEGTSSSSSGDAAPSSSSSGSGGSSGGSGSFACPAGTTETLLRVVTGNLSSRNHSNYDDGTGLRIFKGLRSDIGLVQEMNYGSNSASDLGAFVVAGFGVGFYGTPRYDGSIPNGVVSRFPILASGERLDPIGKTRSFVWARIDVPGDRDVVAFSVHLHTEAPNRAGQVANLLSLVAETAGPNDLVLLGGDFNTDDRNAEGVAELSARFVTAGPYPVDEAGNDGTNTNRLLEDGGKAKPYDWVVGDPPLHERARPFTLGSMSFPYGFVFDSRVFSDPGLMPGVQPNDSQLHQHMAVARTFALCE